MKTFCIVSGDPGELEGLVNDRLDQGWELHGAPFVLEPFMFHPDRPAIERYEPAVLAQAMVLISAAKG